MGKDKAGSERTEPVRYAKAKILTMRRYGDRVDLLRAVLSDKRTYSHDEVAALLEKTMKERVR